MWYGIEEDFMDKFIMEWNNVLLMVHSHLMLI
jgi:hypothetical protein